MIIKWYDHPPEHGSIIPNDSPFLWLGWKKIYQFLWFITLPTPTKLHPGAWIFCSLRSVRRACSRACWALSWKKGYGATVDISWTKSSKGKSVYSCLVLHSECHECPLATVDLQPLPEMMLLKDSNNIKELERDYLGQKGPKECATTCNHKPVSFTNYVWCLLQIIDSLCLRICAPENSMVPHNYVLAGQAACCLPPLSNPRGAPVFQAAGPNGFYWINVYIYIYNSSLIAEWNPLIKPIMNAWNTQIHNSLTLVWVKASMDHPLFPVSHPQICKILTYAQHPREVNLFTAVKHHNRTSQLSVIHWKVMILHGRLLHLCPFASSLVVWWWTPSLLQHVCLSFRSKVCPVWLAFQGSDIAPCPGDHFEIEQMID